MMINLTPPSSPGIPMVHSVKVLDRLACIRGYLKVAVQVMQEEKRSSSTPSPVEFRESAAEEVSGVLLGVARCC